MLKKTTLACLATACWLACSNPTSAQTNLPPSASTEIFDFTGFQDQQMLELFYQALQQGRNYPTDEELESLGLLQDIGFYRSHVKYAPVMRDKTKQLNQDVYENRNLWMNLPTGIGPSIGGYPSGKFSDDVYSMWNYTNIFGAWNHSLFQAPAVWVDAAHKNGTYMYSGIKFFESWGTGDGEYMKMITTKNPDGTFKYTEPLINCLMYFGKDGINYNWEDQGFSNEDIVALHKELYRKAAEKGFNEFHIGIYTLNSSLSSRYVDALLGTTETGKTADVMLNYAGGDFSYNIKSSVQVAESNFGSADDMYTGVWIVNFNRRWSDLQKDAESKRASVCLWGEHNQSRFMSYNVGATSMEFQENYQKLLERAFSGGNRNPMSRPAISNSGNNLEPEGDKAPLSTYCGLASFIPERTAIQGDLPFNTHFALGNGERYNYKGKKTFGNWYNMGAQDLVPTYRWLVYNAGTTTVSTDIQPSFTHEDSYIGGSSLLLSGNVSSAGTDVILYRTKLTVSGANPYLKVAVKPALTGQEPTNLSIIVKKFDSNDWIEYPYGNATDSKWQEKKFDLSGFNTNDVIEYIGVRVKGDYAGNYRMMVGKLEINDDTKATPAEIKSSSLRVEVKEETTKSMSLKLNWLINPTGYTASRSQWDMIYNDEANISHYEVMYKNGAEGRVSEVARTSTRSAFVGNILFDGADDEPYIGVRSASTDLKSYSPIQWVKVARSTDANIPEYSNNPYCTSVINPASEGVDIARECRYIAELTTSGADQNLNYTANAPQADGTQYVDASNHVLKVKQGQKVSLTFKSYLSASKDDGLKWCFGKAYIDYNNSNSFEPDGDEMIFEAGTIRQGTPEFNTGYTVEFTVPNDAVTGQSRLRFVFSDAWFPHPGPCGETAKGFSIDYAVEITGTNPERPGLPDLHDKGIADEPEQMNGTGVESIQGNNEVSSFYPNPVQDVFYLNNAEKVWIYSLKGELLKFVNGNPSEVNISDFASGMYILKIENKNVIRSHKLLKQ